MTDDYAHIGPAFDVDAAVLGGELPLAVHTLIRQAGPMRQQVPLALTLLEEAHALAPDHPATLIALYRFHFYDNRLWQAREVAVRALALALRSLGLPKRWQDVPPDARFNELTPLPRFFLFTLKGYAYLSLRLGDVEECGAAVERLALLDPRDRVGHRVLAEVLARRGRDDIGYVDCPDIGGALAGAMR